MTLKRTTTTFLNNQSGFIFADFIFSLVIAASCCIVLFALTFTFTMVEISQYVVFSASRAHSAAHLDVDQQQKMGNDKFNELIKKPALNTLLNSKDGPWFVLGPIEIRSGGTNGSTFNDDYAGYENRIPFVGARANFTAKLLTLKLPLIGQTNTSGDPLSAKLTAFLIREPTQKECFDDQVKKRYAQIMELEGGRLKGSGTTDAGGKVDSYIPAEDNGC